MDLIRRDAIKIASKLDADQRPGRKHAIVVSIKHAGKELARYTIRHGSDAKHNYIPQQLKLSYTETNDLVRCTFSKEDFLNKHGISTDEPSSKVVH